MQNVIAIIWDFDKTLINGYMQSPIFKEYGVDEKAFWTEVNSMPDKMKEHGIRVNPDTAYLIHFTRKAKDGRGLAMQNFVSMEPSRISIQESLNSCKSLGIYLRIMENVRNTTFVLNTILLALALRSYKRNISKRFGRRHLGLRIDRRQRERRRACY